MKTNYPLPLELTKPVAMATDLDTALMKGLDVETSKYNPETQVRMWGHRRGGHNTNSKCVNYGCIQIDDILQDFSL